MAKNRKTALLSILLVIALLNLPACASGVSQQEYDGVRNQLSEMKDQLELVQAELAEYETAQARYETMRAGYEELNRQYDTVKREYLAVQARYEDLSKQHNTIKSEYEMVQTRYEELRKQYDAIEAAAAFDERDVEQAVFSLVNQKRRDKGLDEQIWGDNLYSQALANSRDMAANKRMEYSSSTGWQEVDWVTGYDTADKMADALLTIWGNRLSYEQNILNSVPAYGAVGVCKSGDIFYITYLASHFR